MIPQSKWRVSAERLAEMCTYADALLPGRSHEEPERLMLDLRDARAEIDTLRAAVRELRAAFGQYADHRKSCYAADPGTHWTEEMTRANCDCGYVQVTGRIVARTDKLLPEDE